MKFLALSVLLLPNLNHWTVGATLAPVAVRVIADGPVLVKNALTLEESYGDLERNPHPLPGEPLAFSTYSLTPGLYVLKGDVYKPGIGEACQVQEQVFEVSEAGGDVTVETLCWED